MAHTQLCESLRFALSRSLHAGPSIIDILPHELLQIIIVEHLEDRVDIQALSRTCHALHSLTSSPALEAAWLWRRHGDQALFRIPMLSLSLAVLRQLVEVHHVNINTAQFSADNAVGPGMSLLHHACGFNRTDILAYLTSVPGVNVNQTFSPDNVVPLHFACMAGYVGAVRQLLALPQIQVNAATSQGSSSLYLACAEQKAEVVEELLRHPDVDVNLMVNARFPLDAAVHMGNSVIVALLLQHPAINVNAVGALGTSLIHAVVGGRAEVLWQLLQHPGVQVNALDPYGRTSLVIAGNQGASGLVAELLRHVDIDVNYEMPGDCLSALREAALQGNTAIVAMLLQHPAIQVNAAGIEGASPLSLASAKGHVHVVRELLRHPDILVTVGHSSLGYACGAGHLAVIQELLEHPGWDAESINYAFAAAERSGHTAVVVLLRGHRAVRRALRGAGRGLRWRVFPQN